MSEPPIPPEHLALITRPVPHADRLRLSALADQPFRPVFVMGLHRSGTTFLYEALASVLPAVPLTVYDILFYPRLLASAEAGTAEAERASLDRHLQDLGLGTRLIDEVPLSARALEEYAWVLQGYGGSLRYGLRTRRLFDTLCRKLAFLSGQERVLLKNPWDLGRARALHRAYPVARFVFIRRNPLETLNSVVRAGLAATGVNPYTRLLEKTLPLRRVVNGWAFKLLARLPVPRRTRLLVRIGCRHVAGELEAYAEAWAALPPAVRHEVRYDDLVRDPATVLREVCAFLGVEPGPGLEAVLPRPRGLALLPEVEACRKAFTPWLEEGARTPDRD
jgi:hypothetical protein